MKSVSGNQHRARSYVAPFAGAWIEITLPPFFDMRLWSLPSRERGLKYIIPQIQKGGDMVAPFAGAWIEIPSLCSYCLPVCVAPFAGAWIEIKDWYFEDATVAVAPFAGAWIEIVRKPHDKE